MKRIIVVLAGVLLLLVIGVAVDAWAQEMTVQEVVNTVFPPTQSQREIRIEIGLVGHESQEFIGHQPPSPKKILKKVIAIADKACPGWNTGATKAGSCVLRVPVIVAAELATVSMTVGGYFYLDRSPLGKAPGSPMFRPIVPTPPDVWWKAGTFLKKASQTACKVVPKPFSGCRCTGSISFCSCTCK